MVAALTHEKKEMLDSKPLMDEIGVEAQQLKDRLAVLVEEDTQAFNKVMEANRLPATTDEEKDIKVFATCMEHNEKAILNLLVQQFK